MLQGLMLLKQSDVSKDTYASKKEVNKIKKKSRKNKHQKN
jgi:hypothetical protein